MLAIGGDAAKQILILNQEPDKYAAQLNGINSLITGVKIYVDAGVKKPIRLSALGVAGLK